MTNDDHQIVRCQCSAKLRVPAAAAGRKVKCPKCGFKILVGAPAGASGSASQSTATAPPPVPAPASDEDSLLDDLFSSEASSETAQGPDLAAHQKACPKCKSQMTKDAKVCLSCGFDPAIIGNEPVKKSKTASKVSKLAAGTGRFGIGCAMSAGGALIGAGVWYGVAIGTGFEIGYIALGVGFLAGLGMKLGYGQENMRGALVSVITAALGIFVAKVLIFNSFANPYKQLAELFSGGGWEVAAREMHRCDHEYDLQGLSPWDDARNACQTAGDEFYEMKEDELADARVDVDRWYDEERWDIPDYPSARLTYLYIQDMPSKVDDDLVDTLEWEEAEKLYEKDWFRKHKEASQRVAAMDSDKIVVEVKRKEANDIAALDEDNITDEEKEEALAELNVGSKTFFKAMFHPIDALFILLALGTAVKVGGGQED